VNHVQLAFRNLQRRRTRSILTILGVALAVGSFITLYGLSRSVHENVERSFEEHGADLTVKRRGIAEPFGGTIPEEVVPEIKKIPGVEDVAGQLITFAATDNGDSVLAAGWSPDSFYWAHVPARPRLPSSAATSRKPWARRLAMTSLCSGTNSRSSGSQTTTRSSIAIR
jgi:hypothetical protein